jgi:exonuclease-1
MLEIGEITMWYREADMGITGLLPILKSIARRVHVSEYTREKVAIDGYSWLHMGAYDCSKDICEDIYTDR